MEVVVYFINGIINEPEKLANVYPCIVVCRNIVRISRIKIVSVVKCPPITKSDGEIYDVTCTKHTRVYNDTCEVSCELGYNLTSSDGVHKCTENGTWSNNVTCERT